VSRLSGIRKGFAVVATLGMAALIAAVLAPATSCLAAPVTVARLQYAGGDWYCDPSSLPNWLAANKGLAPGGHAIVGAAQGGTGALMEATFHPDRYRYAGSLSGFLTPSRTFDNGAITAGMNEFGGVNTQAMWGAAQLGRWKWHDPDVHVQLLADNNTRLWVFSPQTMTCSDPAAMIGYCDIAQGSNRTFYAHYRAVGGRNGHFDFPTGGNHDWGSWSAQLGALANDVAAAVK
jgi:S-formylglutathione hydrolase FrmB